MEVHLDDGSVFSGVFNSFGKTEEGFGIVLKCAHKLEGQERSFSKALDTFVVEPGRIVQLIASKFRFDPTHGSYAAGSLSLPRSHLTLSSEFRSAISPHHSVINANQTGASEGFVTDTDISRSEFRERELTPWNAGEGIPTNDMVTLFVINHRSSIINHQSPKIKDQS